MPRMVKRSRCRPVKAALLAGAVLIGGMITAVRLIGAETAEGGAVPMTTQAADIGTNRQFWFNAQGLVQETTFLRILQPRPVKHSANPILVADRPGRPL